MQRTWMVARPSGVLPVSCKRARAKDSDSIHPLLTQVIHEARDRENIELMSLA